LRTSHERLRSRSVLGMRVDATSYRDASKQVIEWATSGSSRYVCVASVNNAMAARENPELLAATNGSDLVTPDGMPLVWALRALGVARASHVRGTDLTVTLLAKAANEGVPVGFYGSSPRVLESLVARCRGRWPHLELVYEFAPPFQELGPAEQEQVVADIEGSGARILLVGLGCPKQELWMANHRGKLPTVMVGVGAAFDFIAGSKRQAPVLMQRTGLEWLFRLITEPRRLWKRYLKQNPRFLVLLARQLWRDRGHRRRRVLVHRKEST
jgi:N-acetylglucosaminyldiphosphoundecaprenol N-acetyl-beta-D-mannosaminyltransferase